MALVEFCQHGRAEAARANISLRAALSARARLSSSATARELKPPTQRTPQREHDRHGWNGGAFSGVKQLNRCHIFCFHVKYVTIIV